MTPKQEAALRLAREALQYVYEGANNQGPHTGISWRCASNKIEPVIAAIDEALAEQPAQVDPCIDGSCSCCWTHLDEQPASKPWVGLTDDERLALAMHENFGSVTDYAEAIEAKLREKNAQPSKPLTDEQRKAIVVCFTSGKVSVSEVQRKLAISYNEAQQLCQSIVDLKLAQGLQLAPSLDRHGIKGDA